MRLDARTRLLLFIAGFWITALIVGDLMGSKLILLGEVRSWSFIMPSGLLAFPVVFLLTDLLNEFYGKKAARYVTLVGFCMAVFTILILQAALAVPGAAFWAKDNDAAYLNVFGSGTRILFASTTAYLIAQLVDISVFHYLRRQTGHRMLWLRATGSTVVSQLIDTFVVQFIAFGGTYATGLILQSCLTSYAIKVVLAVALTPLIYAGHALVSRGLKIEHAPVE